MCKNGLKFYHLSNPSRWGVKIFYSLSGPKNEYVFSDEGE